jgi:serine/threonine protein kinase
MERAAVPIAPEPEVVFRDGLGERRHVADPSGHETLEVLSLRSDLAAVPSFEFALRERVSRLASFRNPSFGRVRAVERLNDRDATLAVISERTDGVRVSDILRNAETRKVPLDINASLRLVQQLVPAIAALHENARDVAHGALGPERLVLTRDGRVVVIEYVVGAALEQLRFSRDRYWHDLRIALPRTAGLSRFDHRADVTQIGVVALSLILGRLLTDDEYPARVSDLVSSAWAVSTKGGFEPLPPGLRAWLTRALQLDARSGFTSAREAQDELEKVLGDSEYMASQESLGQFLTRYYAADPGGAPAAPAPAAPTLVAPEPVVKPVAHIDVPAAFAAVRADTPHTIAPRQAKPEPVKPEPVKPQPVKPEIDFDFVPRETSRSKPETEPSAEALREWNAAVDPESATNADSGAPAGSRKKLYAAIAAAVIVLAATGFLARQYWTAAPAAPVTTGTLVMNSNPEGAAVIVDGEARGKTPITLTLSPGAHKVELLSEGANRLVPVTITAGAETTQYIELPKVAAATGQLQVRTEPSGAQVTIDGRVHGPSPATIGNLTPGEHMVLVTGELGSVRQKVTVEAGATASLFVPLAAPQGAPVSGWMSVDAPVDMQIFENGQLIGTSKSERTMVSAGRHEVEIVSDQLGFKAVRVIQVAAGKVTPIKLEMPRGTLAVNAVPWAEVWIDGESHGQTPIGNVSLSIGPHDVVFRHPELGERHLTAVVTLKGPARVSADMRQK